MSDQRQLVIASSGSSEASFPCPLCKRTFSQEGSQKRHYYYCRSKLPDTSTSRRRSCAACVRAKTRCIQRTDSDIESCVRCLERGCACQFEKAKRREDAKVAGDRKKNPGSTPTATWHKDKSLDIDDGGPSVTYPRRHNCATTVAPPRLSADNLWDAEIDSVDVIYSGNRFDTSPSVDSTWGSFGGVSNMFATDMPSSTPSPWDLQLSIPSLFQCRTFTKPSQRPLVSLAMRLLRSYPFMMQKKATLPPFLSPVLFSWAETGTGPSQHALLTCASLVDLFKSRTDSNRSVIWRLIRLEQEKILANYMEFDRWQLLDAFQSLLIYCLLRVQEVPIELEGIEMALLTTVNLVFSALVSSSGGILKVKLPDSSSITWTDWIYNESRRRTVLIFQILNIMLELSTEASAYANCGLVLMPLASSVSLWQAEDPETWRAEFKLCHEEHVTYGLSESGVLTKLRLEDAGTNISSIEWEEWRAEVGDIGTLVMMVGALL